ncbi:uncharacterized protein [Leptinotarsa decemlineata]|uniref:uncharacterized protein n=1 Tax=Leptinotarsa decemlineata TaxID=7539 RepID=UPI003D30CFF3
MSNQEEKQLSILEKKREMYFGKMQIIYDLSKKASKDEKRVYEFQIKARTMSIVRKEFIEIIDKINELSFETKTNFIPSYVEVEAFDEMFCVANDVFTLLEQKRELKQQNFPANGGSSVQGLNAKLQPIELPRFSGVPEEWPTFYEIFKKLVHENEGYTNVEKVTHLVTHLEGSARSVCASIPPTADKYSVISKALTARFDDKRALASSYIEKILNFKSLRLNLNKD